ncbi:DUF3048 domain-containing protein [Falsibacillus albus]|uniref:DUF3048 domain-containing protein n=1 Tax=Falsibacillus albus TaxID=2478915 RepID=A0A3L7JJQ2_9BACI|nr:DUF3048 domain-containing protein [Falsibacillus albus]RLQ90674.1 DUF3048 domain-containing protein [Falsibacillus albus]
MLKKMLVLILAAVLMLSACGGKTEKTADPKAKSNENSKTTSEQNPQENQKKDEYPYHYPLTGIGTNEEPKRRSVAVMINNFPAARPQSGLQKADVTYEVLAEGDITRFLAIFQSELPEKVGPVRSARDYFINLAKGYDSLYIAHGYSPEARQMLMSGYIDNLNGIQYDGTLFKRASFRKAPHNSYITFENIQKGADQRGYEMDTPPAPLPFMTKDEADKLTGDDGKNVMISYYHNQSFEVVYEYDDSSKKYKRYSGGELTADLDTKEPVLLDNIFIIETDHKIIDSHGRRDINLKSGGNAYLVQRGVVKKVQWKNIEGRILPYENGKALNFVQGKTWINIVPTDPGLDEMVSFHKE